MGFQEMTYKYFFGSDIRSIPYLSNLLENYDTIKVVTTEPRNTGAGLYLKSSKTALQN